MTHRLGVCKRFNSILSLIGPEVGLNVLFDLYNLSMIWICHQGPWDEDGRKFSRTKADGEGPSPSHEPWMSWFEILTKKQILIS